MWPINVEEIETMMIGKTTETRISINIRRKATEHFKQFLHLGGLTNADGSNDNDIDRRIGHTSQAFGVMNRAWRSRELTTKTKIKIYDTMVGPTTDFPVRLVILDNAKTR